MSYDALRPIGLDRPASEFPTPKVRPDGASFLDTLRSSLGEVVRLDRVASEQVAALAAGKPVDPHEIMLAVEQAGLALDLLIEVRNRLVEAYQELTRTQI